MEKKLFVPESEVIQEKCGIVGIYNPADTSEHVTLGLSATEGVWHRGQQGLGVAMQTQRGLLKEVRRGATMQEVFTSELRDKFNGHNKADWSLYHCIYGTAGGYGDENLQPIIVDTPYGTATIVHNGQFVGELSPKQEEDPRKGVSDTYLFAQLLAIAEGDSWEERILSTIDKAKGAYSLIIGVEDKLFVARDQFGIRPLVLGKIGNGWIAASETIALSKLKIPTQRAVKNGEVIRIDENGLKTIREGSRGSGNFCDFEWAYFSRPDSLWPTSESQFNSPEEWLSFLVFRERCGEIMAREHPMNLDFVVGVPDSGVAFGTGYANALRIPYRQVVLRDHYKVEDEQRTFMNDKNLGEIGVRVTNKLSVVEDPRIWEGKVVGIADDTIVRSNVSKALTKVLQYLGAKEIHWFAGFPPVIETCHLGVSMRKRLELVAARNNGDVKAIAREIGATSVNYISPEGFLRAKNDNSFVLPEDPKEIFLANGGCGGCVTGLYPISKDGLIFEGPRVKVSV